MNIENVILALQDQIITQDEEIKSQGKVILELVDLVKNLNREMEVLHHEVVSGRARPMMPEPAYPGLGYPSTGNNPFDGFRIGGGSSTTTDNADLHKKLTGAGFTGIDPKYVAAFMAVSDDTAKAAFGDF